ncbi:MAG: hypothetical protein ACXABY_37050 [Candidatus Thorarchaeota archaeon]|jgi:rubrerythrin
MARFWRSLKRLYRKLMGNAEEPEKDLPGICPDCGTTTSGNSRCPQCNDAKLSINYKSKF